VPSELEEVIVRFVRLIRMHRQEGVIGSFFGTPGIYLSPEDKFSSSGIVACKASCFCISNNPDSICTCEPAAIMPVLFFIQARVRRKQ
jgi:hypothetical protein